MVVPVSSVRGGGGGLDLDVGVGLVDGGSVAVNLKECRALESTVPV